MAADARCHRAAQRCAHVGMALRNGTESKPPGSTSSSPSGFQPAGTESWPDVIHAVSR